MRYAEPPGWTIYLAIEGRGHEPRSQPIDHVRDYTPVFRSLETFSVVYLNIMANKVSCDTLL